MRNLGPKMKSVIHFCLVVFVLTLIITIVCLLMLRYAVEGENNMPFEVSQLIIVSTAEGIDKETKDNNMWNFDLVQNNDVYIYISKNKNYKDAEIIKSITINNFKIENGPNAGKITIYRPSKLEDKIYEYNEEYVIESDLTYAGAEFTNAKNLEIANQGGIIFLRFCNNGLGSYSSNDKEISHDGTILAKAGVKAEDIKCNVSFDLTIEIVDGTKFVGNIKAELPSGNIIEAGTSSFEKKDFKDVIFKRD